MQGIRRSPSCLHFVVRWVMPVALTIILAAVAVHIFVPPIIDGFARKVFPPAPLPFEYEPLVHPGEVSAVAFSPDSRYVVAGTRGMGGRQQMAGGHVTVWEVATKRPVATVALDEWVTALSFHPDGTRLLVASSMINTGRHPAPHAALEQPGEVRVFEFPAMRERASANFETNVGWARYSPDGATVGVVRLWTSEEIDNGAAINRGELALLDADTLVLRRAIGKPYNIAAAFAFTPDSRRVIAVHHRMSEVLSFDVTTGEFAAMLGHNASGIHMEFSPEGTEVMNVMEALWIYDFRQRTFTSGGFGTMQKDAVFAQAACYAPDGRHLLTTRTTGSKRFARSKVQLVDRTDWTARQVFEDRRRRIVLTCCAYAPDGKHFAVGTDAYQVEPETPDQGRVLLFTAKD